MPPDLRKQTCAGRAIAPAAWENGLTNQDGPGSVGALFVRGLADWIGVD